MPKTKPATDPAMSSTTERINREFHKLIESEPSLRALFTVQSPRYAQWVLGQRFFCYNTEPQGGRGPRWLSWIYEPVGPGRLSGKAKRWEMKRSRRHATRAGAKARAYRLYSDARSKTL